jgi:hypothetical protein
MVLTLRLETTTLMEDSHGKEAEAIAPYNGLTALIKNTTLISILKMLKQ